MSRPKFETGMRVATTDEAVKSNGIKMGKGKVGVIIIVDYRHSDLPYLVEFDDETEWMFEYEVVAVGEED